MHHIIIGNSAAAIGAIEGIRKVDRESAITLFSNESYHTYSRPLISYFLAGKVNEGNMLYRDLLFYQRNNVEARLGTKIVWIDIDNNEVVLESQERVKFDNLLIATGGKPFIPPMEGMDKEGIYTFSKLDDAKSIKGVCFPGAKAVIIGAGLIGLKAAEALRKLSVEVAVVELSNRVLSAILDQTAAGIIQEHLESHQIKFILDNSVRSLNGEWKVSSVTLNDGTTIECDFVIVAIGVIPNTDMLKDTPLHVNRGIVVDKYMRTNIQNVYAAGDVSEGYDLLNEMQRVIPILPGSEIEYEGGFAMNSIGFFDLPMITAGMVNPEGENFEILQQNATENQIYKKVLLKDNKIVGYICINKIDRAGILINLIKEKVNIEPFKNELLNDGFGFVDFPKEYRKQKMLGAKAVET